MVLAPVNGVLERRSLHVSIEGRSCALGDLEMEDGGGDVKLPAAESEMADCGSSRTKEKVPLEWTASRRFRRDCERGRWEAVEGRSSARERRGSNA